MKKYEKEADEFLKNVGGVLRNEDDFKRFNRKNTNLDEINKTVLDLRKKESEEGKEQEKEKDYIEEKYPDEVPEQFQNLLNFFRMTYEDIIILFYNSEHFKNYCSSQKAEQYNEQFIKTKGYSLLDKNGLIKLMKKK